MQVLKRACTGSACLRRAFLSRSFSPSGANLPSVVPRIEVLSEERTREAVDGYTKLLHQYHRTVVPKVKHRLGHALDRALTAVPVRPELLSYIHRQGTHAVTDVAAASALARIVTASSRSWPTAEFLTLAPLRTIVDAHEAVRFPRPWLPEVVVMGKASVGKSAVINAISNRRVCAVAHAPGTTSAFRFITIGRRVTLVDTPPPTYRLDSHTVRAAWTRNMTAYLQSGRPVAHVLYVVDARDGILEMDEECLAVLEGAAVMHDEAVKVRAQRARSRADASMTRARAVASGNTGGGGGSAGGWESWDGAVGERGGVRGDFGEMRWTQRVEEGEWVDREGVSENVGGSNGRGKRWGEVGAEDFEYAAQAAEDAEGAEGVRGWDPKNVPMHILNRIVRHPPPKVTVVFTRCDLIAPYTLARKVVTAQFGFTALARAQRAEAVARFRAEGFGSWRGSVEATKRSALQGQGGGLGAGERGGGGERESAEGGRDAVPEMSVSESRPTPQELAVGGEKEGVEEVAEGDVDVNGERVSGGGDSDAVGGFRRDDERAEDRAEERGGVLDERVVEEMSNEAVAAQEALGRVRRAIGAPRGARHARLSARTSAPLTAPSAEGGAEGDEEGGVGEELMALAREGRRGVQDDRHAGVSEMDGEGLQGSSPGADPSNNMGLGGGAGGAASERGEMVARQDSWAASRYAASAAAAALRPPPAPKGRSTTPVSETAFRESGQGGRRVGREGSGYGPTDGAAPAPSSRRDVDFTLVSCVTGAGMGALRDVVADAAVGTTVRPLHRDFSRLFGHSANHIIDPATVVAQHFVGEPASANTARVVPTVATTRDSNRYLSIGGSDIRTPGFNRHRTQLAEEREARALKKLLSGGGLSDESATPANRTLRTSPRPISRRFGGWA